MQPSTRRRLVFGAALAATASALSCGRGETAAPVAVSAARTPAVAPAPGSTAPPVPAEVMASPEAAVAPKALPDDVPSYPGARIVTSSGAPEQGLLIALQSKDTPEKVFEFYRQKLGELGWSMEGEMNSEDQRMLIAGKGDRKTSVLVSAPDGGDTQITLTLTHGEG